MAARKKVLRGTPPQALSVAYTHTQDSRMESTEIQLARMDERMKMLLDRMEENQETYSHTRNWMQKVDLALSEINSRVAGVETSLAKNVPTIEEFMAIKHKVIGAGMAGRWLWVSLGAILGLIISMRDQISRLLSN